MPHNTSAANVRSQMNLTSTIHHLPNEIIAHIFVVGCPTPNHDGLCVDVAPIQHQMLVGSICSLWREIAHECPALWTSVVVRYPKSENDVKSYGEMICSSLRRSGTLGLDLAIRVDTFPGQEPTYSYCDHVVPHIQRVHTLFLECRVDCLPSWNMPQLVKLRHLYIWGSHASPENPILLSCANSPLETFHFISYNALQLASIPTSRLRDISIMRYRVDEEIAYFINKCNNLQVSALWVHDWAPDAIISSVTLTHLDLYTEEIMPVALLGNLPNLRHLRLHVVFRVDSSSHPSSWPPLPSLRSLSIRIPFGGSRSILPNILHVAPQLVALQIGYDDACEVVRSIRVHREDGLDGGVRRKRLRLLLLMADHTPESRIEPAHSRWGDLPTLAPILHNWDPNQLAAWRSVQINNPIVIDGVEIRHSSYIANPKIFISDRADQLTD